MPRSHLALGLALALILLAGARAEALEPVRYVVRFPAAATQYAEVEASLPTGGRDELEVFMAVWTPGSYLVREYSRNLEGLVATDPDGAPLAVTKTRKNRWSIACPGAPRVTVRYSLYCREMGVQTNWVERDLAVLNGAATFVSARELLDHPHEVRLELPEGWKDSVTALPAVPGGAPDRYRAADFDMLVDSPIVAGNPALMEFEAGGRPHVLCNLGGGDAWDDERSARDVARIVEAQQAFWGVVPYERYVFLNVITEGGGGLEHKGSCLLMTSRWRTGTRKGYEGWLGLVSHEFFHTWNVKRLRPEELGPFDYENEVYTTGLWIAEGFTSYFDDLILCRAGLIDVPTYLDRLGGNIDSLQKTHGRLVQPLSLASFDAWIEHYRRDENSRNTTISYYTKGAVVAWLLDARIRSATDSHASLDDVMRLAYERHSGERGFSAEEFRGVASEVAGVDLSDFFAAAVDGSGELDYAEALAWFGLAFKAPGGRKRGADEPGWIGVETTDAGGRLEITGVPRETPGHAAGFNVGDEILAIGAYRVRAGGLDERLRQHRPGEKVRVLIARRERLLVLEVELGSRPDESFKLVPDTGAPEGAKRRMAAWLTGK